LERPITSTSTRHVKVNVKANGHVSLETAVVVIVEVLELVDMNGFFKNISRG
jgi:hypothetical protein